MKYIKMMAYFISCFTLCISPLAEAKSKIDQQKAILQSFIKQSGLNGKNETVQQFWDKVKPVMSPKMIAFMEPYVKAHAQEKMPQIQVTNIKDGSGQSQVRLSLTDEHQTVNLTLTGDEEVPLKINNVSVTKSEMTQMQLGHIAKKLYEDPAIRKNYEKHSTDRKKVPSNVVMSYEKFKKLTISQKGEYLFRLRKIMEASLKVYETHYGKQAAIELNSKHQWAYHFLMGIDAIAMGFGSGGSAVAATNDGFTGKPCVIAGYLSTYGENQSCGGVTSGAANLSQQIGVYGVSCGSGGDVPCNPLVYGFKEDGSAFCAPKSDIKRATSNCNDQSKVDTVEDKKRIIESFMKKSGKNIDLKFNAEGKLSKDQLNSIQDYLTKLNGLVDNAGALCNNDTEFAKTKKARPDQTNACEALLKRGFWLKDFEDQPTPVDPVPPPDTGNLPTIDKCSSEMIGSQLAADGKTCACPEGEQEGYLDGGKGQRACQPVAVTPLPQPQQQEVKKESNFPWLGLLVGGGILIGTVALFWWLSHKKSNATSTYTPPATTDPTPAPCLSGYTLNSYGRCVLTSSSEGGSIIDAGGNACGIRGNCTGSQ